MPTRPRGYAARAGDCTSIVDLHIREDDLTRLAQRARSYGRGPPHRVDPETWTAWRAFILDLARRAADEPRPPGDPDRRFAAAGLRREIQTALSRCIGVGCRVPASRTDLDHTLDKAKGGKTTAENNGPACRYDHTVKHKAGWKLERIHNGYRWISRLRHVYEVLDPPVSRNLPDPLPDPPGRDNTPTPDPTATPTASADTGNAPASGNTTGSTNPRRSELRHAALSNHRRRRHGESRGIRAASGAGQRAPASGRAAAKPTAQPGRTG